MKTIIKLFLALALLTSSANAQSFSKVVDADWCLSTVATIMPDVATTTGSAYRVLNRTGVYLQNVNTGVDCFLRFDATMPSSTTSPYYSLPRSTVTPVWLPFNQSVPIRAVCNGTMTRPNCLQVHTTR